MVMPATDASFERLVADHQQAVLRVCRSILRDDHLGADAAQETFLRLWREVVTGGAPAKLGGWLRRVAVTTSLDFQRSRTRGARALETAPAVDAAPTSERDPASSPEGAVTTRELFERFERALGSLSDAQRTIFLLKHSGGMSLAQVAGTLNVSLPTVKTHFARACLKLQRALRSFEPRTDDAR